MTDSKIREKNKEKRKTKKLFLRSCGLDNEPACQISKSNVVYSS